MGWKEEAFDRITDFFIKHSPLLKKEKRNLHKHSLVLSAGLNSLIKEMKEDENYSFIDDETFDLISSRLRWVFNQLMIVYRVNYKSLSETEDYDKGFFTITPTGEVRLDQRVYNIPKHLEKRGFYPSLIEDAWTKGIEPKDD